MLRLEVEKSSKDADQAFQEAGMAQDTAVTLRPLHSWNQTHVIVLLKYTWHLHKLHLQLLRTVINSLCHRNC